MKTVVYNENQENAISCPVCGEDCLHHTDVKVYNRGNEDNENYDVVLIDSEHGTSLIPVQDEDRPNPSDRRDGVRISFTCEQECEVPDLMLYQHKGTTYLEWDKRK